MISPCRRFLKTGSGPLSVNDLVVGVTARGGLVYLLTELTTSITPVQRPFLRSGSYFVHGSSSGPVAGRGDHGRAADGRLVATDDVWEPYRLVDGRRAGGGGGREYFRDLQAAGRSTATLRSYGLDLLRWFRFLWAVGVAWDRATRIEARDFCRWLQVGRQADAGRTGAAQPGPAERRATGAGCTRRRCGRTARRCCAASTTSTVTVGTGPMLSTRSRWIGSPTRRPRARASQPDGTGRATSGPGCTGRGCPAGAARVPDEEFNEIFAAAGLAPGPGAGGVLRLHRRSGVGVALGHAQGGVDPGRQLITVVRKGYRGDRSSSRRRRTRSSGCGSTRWRWTG